MTCKDCIHYEVCHVAEYIETNGHCRHFELPRKIGDKIYQTDGVRIYESTIKNIIYETEGIAFDARAIGQSVFLTREKAEKALAERK